VLRYFFLPVQSVRHVRNSFLRRETCRARTRNSASVVCIWNHGLFPSQSSIPSYSSAFYRSKAAGEDIAFGKKLSPVDFFHFDYPIREKFIDFPAEGPDSNPSLSLLGRVAKLCAFTCNHRFSRQLPGGGGAPGGPLALFFFPPPLVNFREGAAH